MTESVRGPRRSFIVVTRIACIGNFVFLRHRWSDELKCVRVHIDVCDGRFNRRHVTA